MPNQPPTRSPSGVQTRSWEGAPSKRAYAKDKGGEIDRHSIHSGGNKHVFSKTSATVNADPRRKGNA